MSTHNMGWTHSNTQPTHWIYQAPIARDTAAETRRTIRNLVATLASMAVLAAVIIGGMAVAS